MSTTPDAGLTLEGEKGQAEASLSQSVYGKGYNGVKTEAADDTPTLPHGFER
jgi:hypothetical protein